MQGTAPFRRSPRLPITAQRAQDDGLDPQPQARSEEAGSREQVAALDDQLRTARCLQVSPLESGAALQLRLPVPPRLPPPPSPPPSPCVHEPDHHPAGSASHQPTIAATTSQLITPASQSGGRPHRAAAAGGPRRPRVALAASDAGGACGRARPALCSGRLVRQAERAPGMPHGAAGVPLSCMQRGAVALQGGHALQTPRPCCRRPGGTGRCPRPRAGDAGRHTPSLPASVYYGQPR